MIRTGFKFTAKFVKRRDTQTGQVTDFQIGDKVKDSADEQGKPRYWNLRVTVWDGPNINDGDQVVLDAIQSIEAREYNGKTYYDMVAKCHVGEASAAADAQAQPPIDDADIALPFDLDLDP